MNNNIYHIRQSDEVIDYINNAFNSIALLIDEYLKKYPDETSSITYLVNALDCVTRFKEEIDDKAGVFNFVQ